MRKNNRGFTFIELVIVIAIIGILAAIAVPRFVDFNSSARIAASKATLGALRAVLAISYANSATAGGAAAYPTSVTGTDFADGQEPINALITDTAAASRTGVTVTSAVPNGTDTGPLGFWYIQKGASAGRAGVFSDGTIDTGSF